MAKNRGEMLEFVMLMCKIECLLQEDVLGRSDSFPVGQGERSSIHLPFPVSWAESVCTWPLCLLQILDLLGN